MWVDYDCPFVTGFTPQARTIIINRAESACERCCRNNPSQIHHRRPRGSGGSRDPLTNTPANGVLLCHECHSWIESNREEAFELGWLVRQGKNPSDVPVKRWNQWVKLDIYGGFLIWPG